MYESVIDINYTGQVLLGGTRYACNGFDCFIGDFHRGHAFTGFSKDI